MELFNKPPKVGKSTPPHQDAYYFKLTPPLAVTLWLPLDPVDDENGCIRYVCGSHGRGMREHARTNTLGFSQGIVDYGRPEDVENEVPMHADPGDLLVHDGMTIHRADGNVSADRHRRALGFVYYAKRAGKDAEAARQYSKELHDDLASDGKI